MAIRHVVSTLPDQKYVAALEAELRELRQMIEKLQGDVRSSGRL